MVYLIEMDLFIIPLFILIITYFYSVFKIFSIEEEEFVEVCNLRVGKNLNLNFSCNDVAWNNIDGEAIYLHFFKYPYIFNFICHCLSNRDPLHL